MGLTHTCHGARRNDLRHGSGALKDFVAMDVDPHEQKLCSSVRDGERFCTITPNAHLAEFHLGRVSGNLHDLLGVQKSRALLLLALCRRTWLELGRNQLAVIHYFSFGLDVGRALTRPMLQVQRLVCHGQSKRRLFQRLTAGQALRGKPEKAQIQRGLLIVWVIFWIAAINPCDMVPERKFHGFGI